MNFLNFKDFDEFKKKMDINGEEAIMLLLNEIEKIEQRIKSHISGSKKSKSEVETF